MDIQANRCPYCTTKVDYFGRPINTQQNISQPHNNLAPQHNKIYQGPNQPTELRDIIMGLTLIVAIVAMAVNQMVWPLILWLLVFIIVYLG